jgi:hypothetical protein
MSIRLDPRRLAALKLLAGEQGVRPGELVTRWIEERLDAARGGQQPAAAGGSSAAELHTLSRRVDELARRLDAFTATPPAPAATADTAAATVAKPRGRPAKSAASGWRKPVGAKSAGARVPLHEEIMAVIGERGPLTAGELATAILERGRYVAPRSAKPFDASTVNARVSNPVYRSRFTRDKGRIGLASAG